MKAIASFGSCCYQRGDQRAREQNEYEDSLCSQETMAPFSLFAEEEEIYMDQARRQARLEEEWLIVRENIDAEEFEKLAALREEVKDMKGHPACRGRPLHAQGQTLLRFLRGRDGNVHKAARMFRESMKWRETFNVEAKIDAWHAELERGTSRRAAVMKTYGFDREVCMDKEGLPIWLMRLTVADMQGLKREVGKDCLLVNACLRMELMHKKMRDVLFRDRKLVRCLQIYDVGDYGRKWSFLEIVSSIMAGLDMVGIFANNYPETTRKVFWLRFSTAIHNAYNYSGVAQRIPERTKDKAIFLSGPAASWAAKITAEVAHEELQHLPRFLISDGDDAFRAAEPRGGIVPRGGGMAGWATSPCGSASHDDAPMVSSVTSPDVLEHVGFRLQDASRAPHVDLKQRYRVGLPLPVKLLSMGVALASVLIVAAATMAADR